MPSWRCAIEWSKISKRKSGDCGLKNSCIKRCPAAKRGRTSFISSDYGCAVYEAEEGVTHTGNFLRGKFAKGILPWPEPGAHGRREITCHERVVVCAKVADMRVTVCIKADDAVNFHDEGRSDVRQT